MVNINIRGHVCADWKKNHAILNFLKATFFPDLLNKYDKKNPKLSCYGRQSSRY